MVFKIYEYLIVLHLSIKKINYYIYNKIMWISFFSWILF